MEILLGILLGSVLGTLAGLLPGLHSNLIMAGLVASGLPIGLLFPAAIVLGIVQSFTAAIPAVFIGAPDPENALAVLPGHRLLHRGQGFRAVALSAFGSLAALIAGVIAIPAILYAFPIIYPKIRPWLWLILSGAVCLLIFLEKGILKKAFAACIFLASGALGFFTLNLKESLLPLLSGLFGIPTIAASIITKSSIPKQSQSFFLDKKEGLLSSFAALLAGGAITLFPSLGPAQAATLVRLVLARATDSGWMIVIGGIATADFLISLATLAAIGKARNGIAVGLQRVLGQFGMQELLQSIALSAIAGAVGFFVTLAAAKAVARAISKIDHRVIGLGTIAAIAAMTVVVSGPAGIAVLLAATALGLAPIALNCNRSHAMGCLILPTIVFYFKFFSSGI